MALSNMTRMAFKACMHSMRSNGVDYTLKQMDCPFEREDMKALLQGRNSDWLETRARWQANPLGDSKRAIVFMTTFIGEHVKAPLP